ncbi:hypothetical protein cyc_04006 [Cyclospora cayetanensis]|uniref:Uncharacterized protein n=1 Tax=Cyclospora cayetanensis TaxID=88456 RepID=A0A1D3CRD7_9EIME|nr:hypothetical protein cyc_04006 [Cyclospora cayetanensis]
MVSSPPERGGPAWKEPRGLPDGLIPQTPSKCFSRGSPRCTGSENNRRIPWASGLPKSLKTATVLVDDECLPAGTSKGPSYWQSNMAARGAG